jgi:hypothetical protein
MRTAFDKNRSRVPACRKVGGNGEDRSPNSGERYVSARSWPFAYRAFSAARLLVRTLSMPRFVWTNHRIR